jgi:hypothetical protein
MNTEARPFRASLSVQEDGMRNDRVDQTGRCRASGIDGVVILTGADDGAGGVVGESIQAANRAAKQRKAITSSMRVSFPNP